MLLKSIAAALAASFLLCAPLARPQQAGGDPTGNLINRLQEAFVAISIVPVAVESTVNERASGREFGSGTNRRFDVNFFHDGPKLDVKVYYGEIDAESRFVEGTVSSRSSMIDAKNSWWGFESEFGRPPERAETSSDLEQWGPYTVAQLQTGQAMEGYFAHDQVPVWERLRGAADLRSREEDDPSTGETLTVLEGTTPGGRYSVWLDPLREYFPRKVVVRKSPGDEYSGGLVRDFKWEEVVYTCEDFEFVTIDGLVLPKACQTMESRESEDGTLETFVCTYSRTEIAVNPDFESLGAFVPDLSNGTKVVNHQLQGIDYRWFDGEILPWVEPGIEEQIGLTVADLAKEPESSGLITALSQDSVEKGPSGDDSERVVDSYNGLRTVFLVILGLAAISVSGVAARRFFNRR